MDIEELTAALGSCDQSLYQTLIDKGLDESVNQKRGRILRVELGDNGSILLDGREVQLEALKHAIEDLKGRRDRVRIPATDSRSRPEIMNVIHEAITHVHEEHGVMPSIEMGRKDDLWDEEDEEESGDTENGVRRLIFGKTEGSENASNAYALECLCQVLGHELDTDDALGDIDDLQIQSPLIQSRMPVTIDTPEDFPVVSYLTAEEVTTEIRRLESIDLSFPEDGDIENARYLLQRCLVRANESERAVISFYY